MTALKTKTYMSPSEFKTTMERFFPGRAQVTRMSEFLHRDLRTIRRWKNNHLSIPPEAAMLLRVMVKHKLQPQDVKLLAQKKG